MFLPRGIELCSFAWGPFTCALISVIDERAAGLNEASLFAKNNSEGLFDVSRHIENMEGELDVLSATIYCTGVGHPKVVLHLLLWKHILALWCPQKCGFPIFAADRRASED